MDRRSLLVAGSTGVVGLIAGCSSSEGSDDDDEDDEDKPNESDQLDKVDLPNGTEQSEQTTQSGETDQSDGAPSESETAQSLLFQTGFESDGLGPEFTDLSEESVTPELTTEHSYAGTQSLLLPSTPGNATANRVQTVDTFSPPIRAQVRVKPLREVTDKTKINFIFEAPDHKAVLRFSRYDSDPVSVVVKDSDGTKEIEGVVSEHPPIEEWTQLSLTIRPGEVTANVDDSEVTVEVDGWEPVAGTIAFQTNAWSSASEDINAALDDFRIETL